MIIKTNILTRLENAAFIRRLFGLLPGPLRRLLDSQRNFVYALLIHVLFLSIFVVSFDWSAKPASCSACGSVDDGSYGTPSMPSANEYKPRYFLVNGQTFDPQNPTMDLGANAGGVLLLRMVNAGLNDHAPAFGGRYVTLVAEDAYPKAYPRQTLAEHMAPQKTKDVLLTLPTENERIVVYDRRLNLTNNNQAGPGGMMVYLSTGGGAAVDPLDLNGDGTINASDAYLILTSSEFGRGDCSAQNPCTYDLNNDGTVNIRDIAILRRNFN